LESKANTKQSFEVKISKRQMFHSFQQLPNVRGTSVSTSVSEKETRTGTSSYSNAFDYDLAGNVEEVNGTTFATYDDANKMTSLSGGSISYDADGNVSALSFPGLPSATFAYEHREKMTQEVSNSTTYNYLYNFRGLRAVRTSPGTVKFYIFAGDTLIGEHTGATASVAYTWGADGLVSQRTLTGTPTTLWHHYGPQGGDAPGDGFDRHSY
jgi:hypothetical protein